MIPSGGEGLMERWEKVISSMDELFNGRTGCCGQGASIHSN